MENFCNVLHGFKPIMVMVLVQTAYAGMNIFYKLVADDGMNLRVLVAYRFLFATAFIVPLALILERKSRPKLSWMVLFQAFLCGLFGGSLAQNLYIESLALTSPTFAAAMSNLIPAMTFIMAICFRLEKPSLGTLEGKAKVFGIVVSVGGAMLLIFYKGVEINICSTHVDLLKHAHRHGDRMASPHRDSGSQLLGSLLALGSSFSIVLWLNILTKMSKRYPCHYSSTALMTVMGSVQAVVFSLCMERERKEWKLGWNIRLLTVAYTGIVTSGLVVILIGWSVNVRGPLFVSMFSPLALVLIVLAGPLILDEKLYLGSILGAMLIVCGLYVMLWGKSEEMKKATQSIPSKNSWKSESIGIVTTSAINNNGNGDNNRNITKCSSP